MPRTKATALEQVDNLYRRASEIKLTVVRKKAEMAMKNMPRCIEPLWEKLQSMGITEESIQQKESLVLSRQAEAVEERKKRKRQEKEEEESAAQNEVHGDGEAVGVMVPLDPIPLKIPQLSDLTVGILRETLLCKLGAHFSVGNLRSLKGAEGSKEGLMRILEFSTALPPDFALKGSLRCYNRLGSVIAERGSKLGRRSALLSLPPDWQEQGIVYIKGYGEQAGSLQVRHRYTDESITVASQDVPDHKSLADLYVQSGWSEQRVSIASRLVGAKIAVHHLANYFAKGSEALADDISPSKLLRGASRSSFTTSSAESDDRTVVASPRPLPLATALANAGGDTDILSSAAAGHAHTDASLIELPCTQQNGHGQAKVEPGQEMQEQATYDESSMAAPVA